LAAKKYYQYRINQALEYINNHLEEPIYINEVAKVAHFSAYHFQRIYKALQGETPYETILRLRLEKAVFLLKHRPSERIGSIARQCGFDSPENFSRQFKARFGFSPSAFKKDHALQNSRIYQENHPADFYSCIEEKCRIPIMKIK